MLSRRHSPALWTGVSYEVGCHRLRSRTVAVPECFLTNYHVCRLSITSAQRRTHSLQM